MYWQVLADCDALTVLAPELAVSNGIDALCRAAPHTQRTDCRWAALLSDLSEARAENVSEGLKAPNAYSLLATRVSGGRSTIKTALKDANACMALLKTLDALRREEPFEGFCDTLVALEQNSVDAQSAINLLRSTRSAARQVKASDFADQGLSGPSLGRRYKQRKLSGLRHCSIDQPCARRGRLGRIVAFNSGAVALTHRPLGFMAGLPPRRHPPPLALRQAW